MKKIKEIFLSVIKKINLDKKSAVVIVIGILGVILLVISEFLPGKEANIKNDNSNEAADTVCTDYEKNIEQRLSSILSEIQGAGKVSVMVTLERTDRNIYAMEEKQSTGNNSSYENKLVTIKSEDGESGILITASQPEIRGVAIVCTGGNSAVVRQNITDTVTAVLGISAAKVSITTMKTTTEDNYEH